MRLQLYDLVTSKGFDYFMFALILANCVAMAYEYPHMVPGAIDTLIIYWRWVQRVGGGWGRAVGLRGG